MDDAALAALDTKATMDLARRAFKSTLHKLAEDHGRTFDDPAVMLPIIETLLTDQTLPVTTVAFALHLASTRAAMLAANIDSL